MSDTIPGPQGWPFIGNLLDVRSGDYPLIALKSLADRYGSIYRLKIGGNKRLFISSYKLLNEACDEKRFEKAISQALETGDDKPAGLFQARNDDPNWGIAHRVLMPAFGPLSIEDMFDDMHDLAKQLALSWARRGPGHRIDAPYDFTKLTLDTIALCAMDYRFNSFYRDDQHAFVDAMITVLSDKSNRGNRLPLASLFLTKHAAEVQACEELLSQTASEIIEERRRNPSDRKDLLNAMINGRDPKTKDRMSDGLISSNMVTFLIAGHETTSSLLSFTMYCLLKNAAAYRNTQAEIDQVLGTGSLELHHLKDLKYLTAVLRESIRLYPPAPGFNLKYKDDKASHFTLGDHVIEGHPSIFVLMEKVHRDPEVYGEDAEEFKPERMLDEKFSKLPKNAWKPFGNGARACIGRTFAWQEALMAMAILLQRFNFRLDDPSYALQVQFNLTIKPKDLFIRASLRGNLDATSLEQALNSPASGQSNAQSKNGVLHTPPGSLSESPDRRITILYGSNTGTCEALARKLAVDAKARGFMASVSPLDASAESLPTDRPVVIFTSSYEGQPPDNAVHFVEWLANLSGEALMGTHFAVFGCGHHDWHDTFQRIPKLIDETIAARGGTRIIPLGQCDVADSNVVDQFDTWKDSSLWPSLMPASPEKSSLKLEQPAIDIEISTGERKSTTRKEMSQATVMESKCLTSGEPEKRHLRFQLPVGSSYRAGDYFGVLPVNPPANVHRVMKRFELPPNAAIKLGSSTMSALPTNTWMAAHDILEGYVELFQPASKKEIGRLCSLATDPAERDAINSILSGPSTVESQAQNSVLNLLERFPSIKLPFGDFLAMLPPLRIRLYSISSSPLDDPSLCSVTYSVLNVSAPPGWTTARHIGVASNYLSTLSLADSVQFSLLPNKSGFNLPPLGGAGPPTPIIMICAGTGIAPFRAFIQERSLHTCGKSGGGGAQLAPALLFAGCRSASGDRLYAEEMDSWQREGVVDILYAFSKEKERSEGCRYVQDRVLYDGAKVKALWDRDARIYICGANMLVQEVASVLQSVLFGGVDVKQRSSLYSEAKKKGRILADVFG